MNVTALTQNASIDDQTDSDYRGMYEELRDGWSLAQFVERTGSAYSKAQWSKYERGQTPLTRTMRNELRRAVGLPPLPPSVIEVTSGLHPDALVAQVGNEQPNRALLVGSDVETAHIYVNGGFAVIEPPSESVVTPVTSDSRPRRRYARLCVPPELGERVKASQFSSAEIVAAGLAALLADGD